MSYVSRSAVLLAAGIAVIVGGAPSFGADRAEMGAKVFANECSLCHSLQKGEMRVGPPLDGVVGRPIASVQGYGYSQALEDYGKGKVWTEDRLDTFLANPVKTVPGTRMAYRGLGDQKARTDLITYLKEGSDGG
ncbi:c-type cytochrome [Pararhizobium mangrovi]|uniref:Cytochrome c family protein n=1 Tax=Pararhizobium mangrovi TaxID=2590452 RepID=A0A506UDS1_9HYPH|nr:cytochrome c family protein [Pararhizobium mangrovi]TPW31281.1 cytochrome c family protein [Pararhizobium mangrovi]